MAKRMMTILLLVSAGAAVWLGVQFRRAAGALPSGGGRLERCRQSPHWRGGHFANRLPTLSMTGREPPWKQLAKFLFRHPPGLRPDTPVPAVRTDLDALPRAADALAPRRVLPCHNSRYTIANHPWTEPLERIFAAAPGHAWALLLPRIGEPVLLGEPSPPPVPWWRVPSPQPADSAP